jgi:ribosomal protein S18 acetylase RimI-like enzyme
MEDDYERRVVAHQLWVLELDDVIIGVIVLEDHETSLFIENVAVHPTWQGRGFGNQLMTFAEEEALRRGYSELHLCTSELMTENIARYRHLGFRETSRISGRSSLRVCMAKHVSR